MTADRSLFNDVRRRIREAKSPLRMVVMAKEAAAILDAADEMARMLDWYAERRNYAPAGGESAYDAITARDSYDAAGPGARARQALRRWEAVDRG